LTQSINERTSYENHARTNPHSAVLVGAMAFVTTGAQAEDIDTRIAMAMTNSFDARLSGANWYPGTNWMASVLCVVPSLLPDGSVLRQELVAAGR
jgi:cellulase/cellobiase CelA1